MVSGDEDKGTVQIWGNTQESDLGERGWAVIEDFVPPHSLEEFRVEADLAVEAENEEMERSCENLFGLSVKGERYYVAGRWKQSEFLKQFLLEGELGQLAKTILGGEAYLFNDVFIIKMSAENTRFVWHQDGSYMYFNGMDQYEPNLCFWVAVDDMTAENGALLAVTYEDMGGKQMLHHDLSKDWNREELTSATNLPYSTLAMKAGGLVVFSGHLLHSSGANRTSQPRRGYLVQYSPKPVYKDGVPFQGVVQVP